MGDLEYRRQSIITIRKKQKRKRRRFVILECEKCGSIYEQRYDHFVPQIMNKERPIYCQSCTCKRTYSEKVDFPENPIEFWVYLAGFLDGEGCLTKTEKSSYQMTIAQVNKEVLDYIYNHIPTAKIGFEKRSRKNKNWSDVYRLRITNFYVIDWVIENIKDYLIVKRDWIKKFGDYKNGRIDNARV